MDNDIIIIGLAVLGLVAHFLKKLIDARQAGERITLWRYCKKEPYKTLSSIVLCVAGMLMLWGTDELTRTAAFMFGYFSESVTSMVMRKMPAKID